MDPELPTPQFRPENLPQPNQENVAEQLQQGAPELGGFERYEQKSESQSRAVESAPRNQQAFPVQQTQQPVQSASGPTQPQGDDVPLVASDDDLIEKEWVDKAKKILVSTRDDPYRRERDVVQLQKEYLRKRYGRELGGTD